jgi:hypothetical protein
MLRVPSITPAPCSPSPHSSHRHLSQPRLAVPLAAAKNVSLPLYPPYPPPVILSSIPHTPKVIDSSPIPPSSHLKTLPLPRPLPFPLPPPDSQSPHRVTHRNQERQTMDRHLHSSPTRRQRSKRLNIAYIPTKPNADANAHNVQRDVPSTPGLVSQLFTFLHTLEKCR